MHSQTALSRTNSLSNHIFTHKGTPIHTFQTTLSRINALSNYIFTHNTLSNCKYSFHERGISAELCKDLIRDNTYRQD